MKAAKNKEVKNNSTGRKKIVVKIIVAILIVLAIAFLIGLIATGKAYGWGPFSFLRVRPVSVSQQPFTYEQSKVYCKNGDKDIYGTLYVPKDGQDKRGIVILSHGFNGTSTGNAYLAKSFASSGIAVYAFDFCGGSVISKSDGNITEMSILTEKEDLNCVIETVKTWDWVDPEHIVLFGESQGGCVSALTAASRDDISALVLFYPAMMIPSNVTREYASTTDIPENPETLGQKVGKIYFTDIWGLDAFEMSSAYTGPVLIVHGTYDTLVPSEVSVKMNELYTNSQMYLLEGGGHGFVGDQVREAVEQVYGFLTPLMK
jgi:dienelactone hydrolase